MLNMPLPPVSAFEVLSPMAGGSLLQDNELLIDPVIDPSLYAQTPAPVEQVRNPSAYTTSFP